MLSAAVTAMAGCAASDASSFYKEATSYMEGNEFEKAREAFEKAIALNPDRAEYYIDCAFACLKLKDYEGALAQFDKAYSEKDNQIVRENNKKILRGKGIMYFEQGLYSDALECFENALAIEEEEELNVDIEKYLGAACMRTGMYSEALDAFNNVISKKRSDPTAYASRASAYMALGEPVKASEDYDNAIALDPGNFSYYIGKYNMYMLAGDTAEADKVLQSTYSLKTRTAEDYYNLAVVHYLCGDITMAESEFVISAGDGFYESYYYLGNISIAKEDYDNAEKYYALYAESMGTVSNATYYDGLSECKIHRGDYEGALEDIESGLLICDSTNKRNLLFKKVAILEKFGKYSEALKVAASYLGEYPEDERMAKEITLLKKITE